MAHGVTTGDDGEVESILAEIRGRIGFLPPGLEALKRHAPGLRAAWSATLTGYVDNPLPGLFKEKFMAMVAKYQRTPYSLVVRACSLRRMGMGAAEIHELLREPMPRASLVVHRLRHEGAAWMYESGWGSLSSSLERWILWALLRITQCKDRGGRCRNALSDLVGAAV